MNLRYFLLLFLILTSCNYNGGANSSSHKKVVINIAGSTSVMPFTEKIAEYFMVAHPEYIINVQSGGSTAGIQACLNKTVNIGMSSRELKESEKVLNAIIICNDGIAVVVNSINPIKNLSLEQVRDIFAGKITNWKQLGWIDRKIDVVTREEGAGTRGAFEELVMHKEHIDDGVMVQDSNGSVKEVIRTDPYSIGYISLGIVDDKVKAVDIDNVPPTVENIRSKKYKIVRPFLYLTNGKPTETENVFINFVLSKEGQEILRKEGLVPVND